MSLPSGQRIALGAGAVDHGLHRAVQYLDHQDEQHGADEQRPLDARTAQVQAQRYHRQGEDDFLAKGRLFAPGMPES